MSDSNPVANIKELIDEFNVVMLVTLNKLDAIHARPMSVADFDEDSGDLFFATSAYSGKTEEVEFNPKVSITMQSGKKYVSLSGTAEVINDRGLIHKLYNRAWDAWFPQGPDQVDIRLIRFSPDVGEYWDLSGLKGLRLVWEAGKAMARDEKLDYDDSRSHAKVAM